MNSLKYPRYIFPKIQEKLLQSDKVIILYGSRQVGKTTLLKQLIKTAPDKVLLVQGDNLPVREQLGSLDIATHKKFIGDYQYLFIDEAQYIDQIGQNLKLIHDNLNIKIVATGSSSFDLANQVGEPLVGRKWEFQLFPFSALELKQDKTAFVMHEDLPERLIYGSYPEVVLEETLQNKTALLSSIIDHYLFKDLLVLEELRKSQKLVDLLRLIAFQIGKEVSISELASNLSVNFATVSRYLDLLCKVFVLIRVEGFSRNLRKEISKNARYYFLDNGVRNALINNFNPLNMRNDVGQLWENYLFVERLKKRSYMEILANHFFWRTHSKQEIDLVEEMGGKLFAYEFKWSEKKKVKPPKEWLDTYENASFELINQSNYLDFIA